MLSPQSEVDFNKKVDEVVRKKRIEQFDLRSLEQPQQFAEEDNDQLFIEHAKRCVQLLQQLQSARKEKKWWKIRRLKRQIHSSIRDDRKRHKHKYNPKYPGRVQFYKDNHWASNGVVQSLGGMKKLIRAHERSVRKDAKTKARKARRKAMAAERFNPPVSKKGRKRIMSTIAKAVKSTGACLPCGALDIGCKSEGRNDKGMGK